MTFLNLGDAAESRARMTACFVRRHAGANVVVDVMREVTFELGREVAIEPIAAKLRAYPREHRPQPSHDCSPGTKKRSMMPVVRCHSRAAFASCFRPARVNE